MIRAIIVVFVTLLATGCGKKTEKDKPEDPEKSQSLDLADAGDFIRHLHAVTKRGDKTKWGAQLSEARRARGPEYVDRHWKAWAKGIADYVDKQAGGDASKLRAEIKERDDSGVGEPSAKKEPTRYRLKFWVEGKEADAETITVTREGGRIVIDEN